MDKKEERVWGAAKNACPPREGGVSWMSRLVHSRGVGGQNWFKIGPCSCWMTPKLVAREYSWIFPVQDNLSGSLWLILIWPLHAWKLSQIHFKNSSWLNNRKLVNWIGLLQIYWINEIQFESWAQHPAQSTFIDYRIVPKGGFFSEKVMCFSNLQKKHSKSLSWT